jgi:hypothetical protein
MTTDNHHSVRLAHAGAAFAAQPQHDEIDRARQAAEALFAAKPRSIEPPSLTAALSADQPARKPRILSAAQVQPSRDEPYPTPVVAVSPKPARKIPASHLGRVRTWLKYGMTRAQVANVYGVTVDEIEASLKKA